MSAIGVRTFTNACELPSCSGFRWNDAHNWIAENTPPADIIGPNSGYDWTTYIPASEVAKAVSGRVQLEITMYVEYHDNLEPTETHHLGICIKLQFVGDAQAILHPTSDADLGSHIITYGCNMDELAD